MSDRRTPGWVVGGGAYYLMPFPGDNTAFIATLNPLSTAPITITTNFDWNYSVSPLIWVGRRLGEGFGLRARFFHFEQASDQPSTANDTTRPDPSVINAAPGLPDPGTQGGGVRLFTSPSGLVGLDFLSFASKVRIETIDLEFTKQIAGGQWSVQLAGGGRYLQSAQVYQGLLTNDSGPMVETVEFGHSFYGAGPTLACAAHWYLGASRWALFFSTRGSLLVGSTRQAFTSSQSNPVQTNQLLQEDKNVISVGELELGVEITQVWLDASWFLQSGVVNQTYLGLGSPSRPSGDLSLFGLQLSLGVGY